MSLKALPVLVFLPLFLSSPAFAQPAGDSPAPASAARNPVPPVPRNNPGSWINSGDYPLSAIQNREEGVSAFQLVVAPDGTVASCRITASSGSTALDAATCDLVRERALFRPAADAERHPVIGTYSSKVRWQIPVHDRPPPPARNVRGTFIVGKDGVVSNCRLIEFEVDMKEELNREAAASLRDLAERSFCMGQVSDQPYTDEAGKPVRKRVTVTQRVEVEPLGD